jgi:hypothetical protein
VSYAACVRPANIPWAAAAAKPSAADDATFLAARVGGETDRLNAGDGTGLVLVTMASNLAAPRGDLITIAR